MQLRKFSQVNVFSDHPLKGNPLAVVIDGSGLSDKQMLDFARWTNLSETTFLLPPESPQTDYRLRIFTPRGELDFAGHPTLGSCYVWQAGLAERQLKKEIIQECNAGLINIRAEGSSLAFKAPERRYSGPLNDEKLRQIRHALGLRPEQVLAHQRVGTGSDWLALLLDSRDRVLDIRPDYQQLGTMVVGVAARCEEDDAQLEVRAFVGETQSEDPVTGSLNSGLARWLVEENYLQPPYTAAQGTVMGRAGRVYITRDSAGELWVGGKVVPVIDGSLSLP